MRLKASGIILGALFVGSSFVACSGDSPIPRSFEDPPSQDDPECPTHTGDEQTLAGLSNDARREAGKRAFTLDPQLSRVARRHTSDMIAAGELVHSTPTELKRRVTDWVELNENIGKGGDVEWLFRSFMNSDSHRRRIMDPTYNHVGIGILEDTEGSMWVTMVFQSKRDPGTTLSRPTCS